MYQDHYFPRPELKHRGKAALSGHWKVAIAITVITLLLSGLMVYAQPDGVLSGGFNNPMSVEDLNQQMMQMEPMDPATLLTVQLIGLISSLLINGVLALASIKWYLSVAQGLPDTRFSDFISNFSYGLKGVLAYLWQNLWLLLWSFVYMIPVMAVIALATFFGIASESAGMTGLLVLFAFVVYLVLIIRKGLSYSQQFYIIGDNPHIGVRRALRLSIAMTEGRLLDLFVLGLSFIGWYLLIPVTLGVGALYVMPYVNATYTQMYLWLRDRALDSGIMDPDIFGLVKASGTSVHHELENPSTLPHETRHDRIEELPNASERDIENLDRALGKNKSDDVYKNDRERV